MSLLSNLFTKARNTRLFTVVVPPVVPNVNLDYLRAYTGWVYACVRAIATEVSTIELELQQLMADGEWQRVQKPHAATMLLHDVNPFMTSDQMWFALQAYQDLTGRAYLYVAYNAKKEPTELWVLDPTRMIINRSSSGGIDSYVYQNDQGERITLQTWEILDFKDFNPLQLVSGWGSVRAAAINIDIDTNASKWNRNFFYNSAIPTFTLESEQNLSDAQYSRLLQSWKNRHQGVANAHEPAVLEGGVKANILSHTPKEMDFIEQQKYQRDSILAIFGVPKSVLGITEDVNRANAEAGEYTFAKRVTYPRMRFIATTLSEFYLPLWGLSSKNYRYVSKNIVPENIDTEVKRKQAGLASGYYTINEVRAEEGLDAVDGGDETLVPTTMRPLSQALKPPQPVGNAPMDNQPQDQSQKGLTKSLTTKRLDFIHASIGSLERHVNARLVAESKRIQKDVKKATKAAGDDTSSQLDQRVFSGWQLFIGDLAKILVDALNNIVNRAGQDTALSISIRAGFDMTNPRVVDWIREHSLEAATQVADTFQTDIRSILSEGITSGKSTAQIGQDIAQFFNDQSSWRAMRIARTETITAYAQGSQEAARQAGATQKMWLTAGDDRVDEECRMNGEAGWIDREAAFPSGDIAPVVHPNCRCVCIYRNEGD